MAAPEADVIDTVAAATILVAGVEMWLLATAAVTATLQALLAQDAVASVRACRRRRRAKNGFLRLLCRIPRGHCEMRGEWGDSSRL